MEDADLLEQNDCDPAALALGHFRAETDQQRFDVLPSNIRARRVGEDCFQRLLANRLPLGPAGPPFALCLTEGSAHLPSSGRYKTAPRASAAQAG